MSFSPVPLTEVRSERSINSTPVRFATAFCGFCQRDDVAMVWSFEGWTLRRHAVLMTSEDGLPVPTVCVGSGMTVG
jgi:hypothetical protein